MVRIIRSILLYRRIPLPRRLDLGQPYLNAADVSISEDVDDSFEERVVPSLLKMMICENAIHKYISYTYFFK